MMGQSHVGAIHGKVREFHYLQPINNVLILLNDNRISVHTDVNGEFKIDSLPAGRYTLFCIKSGYYCTVSEPIVVNQEKISYVELKMLPGSPDKYLIFSIGDIVVTGERNIMPVSPATVYKISSGEIEHIQAMHLGDVLDLIPGIIRRNRPGLDRQAIVGLRGVDDRSELFGLRILIDDFPLSNNANLNFGPFTGFGSKVQSYAGTGIDLREIAADNIEEVEVISGVPPVEYGDLTSGLIKVRTADKPKPTRFKLKHNPNTREANLNGGINLSKSTTLNFNLNYAFSEKDLRQDGDEVSRISAQMNLSHRFPERGIRTSNRFYFTRFFEDYSLPDNPKAVRAYNRDFKITWGSRIIKNFNKRTSVYISGYLTYTQRNSLRREFEVIDPIYLSNLMESGTIEGILQKEPYFWEVRTRGDEYNLGLKFKFKHHVEWRRILHDFLVGFEYNYDVNNGPGKQFDPLRPPRGKAGLRPRRFDDVPGVAQFSLFFEDRLTTRCVLPLTLSLGMRGEVYGPKKLGGKDFISSQFGTFWNPRIGAILSLTDGLQLRSSFGMTSKMLSLLDVYPAPVYYDYLEWGKNWRDPSGRDSIALVTTRMFPVNNPDLRGCRQRNVEMAFDFIFKKVKMSVTGYQQKTTGLVRSVALPLFDQRYYYPNWPSTEGKILRNAQFILLNNYEKKDNLGWSVNEGVEFFIHTPRIKPLNTIFRITGAFQFRRSGASDYPILDYPRVFEEISGSGDTLSHYAYPFYRPLSSWKKNFIMNYSIDYVNRQLGIWLTFTIYHHLYEKRKKIDLSTPFYFAEGYLENGQYFYIAPEQAQKMGLFRTIDQGDLTVYKKPANYYFNLTVSKTIRDGMEVSIFVNNLLNDRGFYIDQYGFTRMANPEIFYGMEFSFRVEPFSRYVRQKLFKNQ